MRGQEIYQTLADFFRSIGLQLGNNEEMTVLDLDGLHGRGPIQSPSFRTNYYAFLLIEDGKGSYKIDEYHFELKPWTGYIITFTESFFRKYYHGSMTLDFPFLVNETIPVMHLSPDIFAELKQIIQLMQKSYDILSPYKYQMVVSYLTALLFRTKELLLTHRVFIKGNTRSLQIFNEFRRLVDKNMRGLMAKEASNIWMIKEYADQMNIHPNYLSNTIKEQSGKSANLWIKERTVSEIQGLLINSTLSITEIAHLFRFSSQPHFSRYFKAINGQPPSQFRKKNT